MPNQVMNSGRAALAGVRDWTADTIKAVLVDNTYTFSASHSNLSDVPAGARIATATLASKTATNGVLTATSPITFSSVTSPNSLIGIYVYYDSGTASTSTLLAWFDGTIALTIAATSSTATFTIDPLQAQVSNSSVLTRTAGTGATSITLSAAGGGAANARSLTATAGVSVVAGDVYSVAHTSAGLPITSNPNGGNVTYTIDSTNGLIRLT